MKYTQQQVKNQTEITRNIDGKPVTFIRFKAVLRYSAPNPNFREAPTKGEADTRTASQKRRTIWKEVSRRLEVPKVTDGRKQAENARRISEAVEEYRAQMEAEAEQTDGAKKPVTTYIANYIALRSRVSVNGMRKLEDSTALDYSKVLRKLSPDFDHITMAEVTPKFIKDWYRSQLEKGVSVHAVRKCHRLLSVAFRYAFKQEDIDVNPMERVDSPATEKKEADSLSRDDMRMVTAKLESMEPTPVVVAAYIGLHAGLRCAEVCALRWRDIDFEAGTITIRKAIGFRKGGAYEKSRTKSGKSRTVDFDSEHMAEILASRKNLMLAQRDNITTDFQELFVVGDVDGNFANPTTISRQWTVLTKQWNLTSVSGGKANFHLLRHSYITAALEAGANLKDVSANAGHASVAMTGDVYATALRKGKRKAAQAAGDFMRPKADAPVLPLAHTGTEG